MYVSGLGHGNDLISATHAADQPPPNACLGSRGSEFIRRTLNTKKTIVVNILFNPVIPVVGSGFRVWGLAQE